MRNLSWRPCLSPAGCECRANCRIPRKEGAHHRGKRTAISFTASHGVPSRRLFVVLGIESRARVLRRWSPCRDCQGRAVSLFRRRSVPVGTQFDRGVEGPRSRRRCIGLGQPQNPIAKREVVEDLLHVRREAVTVRGRPIGLTEARAEERLDAMSTGVPPFWCADRSGPDDEVRGRARARLALDTMLLALVAALRWTFRHPQATMRRVPPVALLLRGRADRC
jgi:hypothetical protein